MKPTKSWTRKPSYFWPNTSNPIENADPDVKIEINVDGINVDEIINNCRADAVFISSGLLKSFENSIKKNSSIKQIIEVGTKRSNYINFDEEIQKCSAKDTIKCSRDEVAFWLYSSGSTGQPKGVKHVHGSLEYTYKTYGKQVLKIKENDIVFSVAKLFFAYGLGNAMTFPMSVGATTILLPERPTPEIVSKLLLQFYHGHVCCQEN